MGILGKLFKRKPKGTGEVVSRKRSKQLARLSAVIDPLPEAKFWKIIASVAKKKRSMKQWEESLEKKLSSMKLDMLLAFQLRVDELLTRSYHEDLLCAFAILEGSREKMAFDGFRCWLIMQGKESFGKAIQDPDAIADILVLGVEDHYFPLLKNAAINTFLKQSGKTEAEVAAYIVEFEKPELVLNWEMNDAYSMKAICPRLWEHVHG
jgi:hypothetical protein